MFTVESTDLPDRSTAVLSRVRNGEAVIITIDGEPVAQIVPLTDHRSRWLSGAELVRRLRSAQADPGMSDDLDDLVRVTDDLGPVR